MAIVTTEKGNLWLTILPSSLNFEMDAWNYLGRSAQFQLVFAVARQSLFSSCNRGDENGFLSRLTDDQYFSHIPRLASLDVAIDYSGRFSGRIVVPLTRFRLPIRYESDSSRLSGVNDLKSLSSDLAWAVSIVSPSDIPIHSIGRLRFGALKMQVSFVPDTLKLSPLPATASPEASSLSVGLIVALVFVCLLSFPVGAALAVRYYFPLRKAFFARYRGRHTPVLKFIAGFLCGGGGS